MTRIDNLFKAIRENDYKKTNKLLETSFFNLVKAADVNSIISDGDTPLIVSSEKGYYKIAELLILNGADVNAKNSKGNTSLIQAVCNGNYNIVKLLIENKVDVNAENNFGNSALIFASLDNKTEIIELLISKGANPNIKSRIENNLGDTPLAFAIRKNNKKIIDLLIANGVDVNVINSKGYTLIHETIRNCQSELVQLLIKAGADINKKSIENKTPIQEALKYYSVKSLILKSIIQKSKFEYFAEAIIEKYPKPQLDSVKSIELLRMIDYFPKSGQPELWKDLEDLSDSGSKAWFRILEAIYQLFTYPPEGNKAWNILEGIGFSVANSNRNVINARKLAQTCLIPIYLQCITGQEHTEYAQLLLKEYLKDGDETFIKAGYKEEGLKNELADIIIKAKTNASFIEKKLVEIGWKSNEWIKLPEWLIHSYSNCFTVDEYVISSSGREWEENTHYEHSLTTALSSIDELMNSDSLIVDLMLKHLTNITDTKVIEWEGPQFSHEGVIFSREPIRKAVGEAIEKRKSAIQLR